MTGACITFNAFDVRCKADTRHKAGYTQPHITATTFH
jgi:hypothetical protein